jgi:hypothetical protein
MLYWWPLVHDLPVPKPRTWLVEVGHRVLVDWLDAEMGPRLWQPDEARRARDVADEIEAGWAAAGDWPGCDQIIDARGRMWWMAIQTAAQDLGAPLFLRNDLGAGKYDWRHTCYLDDIGRLRAQLANVLEAGVSMGQACSGIALRQYIQADWRFKAFHGQMPIAPERRLFVDNGRVVCWHPYWGEEMILAADRRNWELELATMNLMGEDEIELLIERTEMVGERLEGYWSVDWMRGQDGEWYLIDVALGHDSWHPACEVVARHREYDTV